MAVQTWRGAGSWLPWWYPCLLALILGSTLGVGAALASPLVSVALLIGAATILAVLREPATGLYLLIALIYSFPFAVVPLRLGAQLTALEALLVLTSGAVLLRTAARREVPRLDPLTALLLGVLGLASVSFVLNLPTAGNLVEVSRGFFKLILAMLVFPLALHLVQGRGHLRGLLIVLLLAGGLQSAVSLVLASLSPDGIVSALSRLGPLGYPTGPAILRFVPGENDTYTDIVRATGTVIDPNVLGGQLMVAAALLLTQLLATRPLLPRPLLLLMGILSVAAMLLSHSRASWVGLAGALVLMAVLRYRRLWLAIIPAALAVMFIPAGRALYARVIGGFAGQDKAAGMRISEYRNAIEIVKQHPWLGIGFGNAPSIDLAPGVSSLYLTVAERMGLPALALYLSALGWLLWRAVRAVFTTRDVRLQGLLVSLLTALLAALVAGLFDHYFASTVFPHTVALFWLVCGMLWRAVQIAERLR
jgi:hypothetical protein